MAKEVNYIGKSLAEARALIATNLNTGTYADGTEIKPEVKEALSKMSQALAVNQLASDNYVICWSLHCLIIKTF